MSPELDPALDPEPSLPNRIVYVSCVAAAAAALFVLVSGVNAGAGQDPRLQVAQCWHEIETEQPAGDVLHDMRVACQQLESHLAQSTRRRPEALVASQE
ncbi:hypothetical protein GT347_03250 [Xylophilus rhododendri]|uniref:Uncharacterized protein n=1 Tax=Xylophilus rhododendri TaxID=2697032 RepID=A0A857J2I9_9BURK|nr:hypothetical protein [Xylophilus rhododendri]QHI97085.1 hypothetical protein GT347_03250 [Xylophilus rhododendri]